ncbi:MAG: ion transporter [Bdellovibrionota bacterium]
MRDGWRNRLHTVVFESDTPGGKAFDVALIWIILISVALVMVDSMASMRAQYGNELYIAEWVFTIVFTIEFILRLISVDRPLRYIFSFYGIIDLLAILPTYLSFMIPGAQSLLVVRVFRLLRVFRILKLGTYIGEAQMLSQAMKSSRAKITVFLLTVAAVVVTMGALMYVIEGQKSGFTSIPMGVYWSIVTLTTVGFGDITPQTPLGKILASLLMILGYGIIAVPTGIVTTELVKASRAGAPVSNQACPSCAAEGHDFGANYCKVCGAKL